MVDYGEGVSDEQLPRLFELFFTTKKEGLGLGLSICHAIVSSPWRPYCLTPNATRAEA